MRVFSYPDVCLGKDAISYDIQKCRKKYFTFYGIFVITGIEGFEPSKTVLETGVMPFHYIPKRNRDIIVL